MKKFAVKFASLPLLLLLLLWFNRCHAESQIFFPFGSDEGDSVVRIGYRTCDEVNTSHKNSQVVVHVSIFPCKSVPT